MEKKKLEIKKKVITELTGAGKVAGGNAAFITTSWIGCTGVLCCDGDKTVVETINDTTGM